MAGELGFEPRLTEPKSGVLPLLITMMKLLFTVLGYTDYAHHHTRLILVMLVLALVYCSQMFRYAGLFLYFFVMICLKRIAMPMHIN